MIISIRIVNIGTAIANITIFPAISILEAIEPCPASFVICEANSTIYAIPMIFKIVSTYTDIHIGVNCNSFNHLNYHVNLID